MKSRFCRPAVVGFERIFRPWMRRRIHAVRMTGLPPRLPAARPLLLAANHVSWWDAFVLREVQRTLRPKAPLYTVMSRAELDRFPFFRLMGAIGIAGSSPASIAHALRFLDARLATHRDAVILFFPQGRIWPSYRRPLGFQRGVELFVRRLSPLVVPVGAHAEPLNRISPTFFVSAGEPIDASPSSTELERRVEHELDAILAFLAAHGEDAPRHWPGPYGRLARSRGAPWSAG